MTYNEELNECLAAIKSGNQTQFYNLVQLTYTRLIGVARSYLIDKSCAEAVMSDLYYKIYLYADHYDTSKDAYTYLWQIVKRIAYDYDKKYLKNPTVNVEDIPVFDTTDQFTSAITKMDIVAALKKVGHINAMIMIWTYRDGLTQEEIGEMLNITKSAVNQRLTKTKDRLKNLLQK